MFVYSNNLYLRFRHRHLLLLGEPQYKAVLQRIASNPPFKHITKQISSSPFLLGYLVVDEEVIGGDEGKNNGQKAQYCLARAEEIYIVDNSFLRRQFPMLVSPMEQVCDSILTHTSLQIRTISHFPRFFHPPLFFCLRLWKNFTTKLGQDMSPRW